MKPICTVCGALLKFVRWSKRYPEKSEALAVCPAGCGKFQIRYCKGKPTTEPYQVRKCEKNCRGSYRLSEKRQIKIIALWGSVQNYLDNSVVQIGMTQQYKH